MISGALNFSLKFIALNEAFHEAAEMSDQIFSRVNSLRSWNRGVNKEVTCWDAFARNELHSIISSGWQADIGINLFWAYFISLST